MSSTDRFVPSKIIQGRIGVDGTSKEYVSVWKAKGGYFKVREQLLLVLNEEEMKITCPKLLQRHMEGEYKVLKHGDSGGSSSTTKESKEFTDSIKAELRQDVERTVKRLQLLLDNIGVPKVDKLVSKHLSLLHEYANMKSVVPCFMECGAVEVLVAVLNLTQDSEHELRNSAGYVLNHLVRVREHPSIGTQILLKTLKEDGRVDGHLKTKQEIVLQIFSDFYFSDPASCITESLPSVSIPYVYSLIKDYTLLLSHAESLMDSSHGMLLPLHAAGSCELLPITGAQESVDVQASFRLFCQFSRLILKITKLLTWKRSAHQGVDHWEKASILAIPQKSSRRRNVYKSRKDFSTDQQYTEYVKSVLTHGMKVICIQSFETIHIGEIGKFVKCVDYHPPAVIKWDRLSVTLNFPYTHIGILPTESLEMTCEDQRPCGIFQRSFNIQATSWLNPSLEEGVSLRHWWELLCAVQDLPADRQNDVCSIFKVQAFDNLLTVQPSLEDAAAVLMYLKIHHPEGLWREFSLRSLPDYWKVSNERPPYEVTKAFEEQWNKKVKSISGADRFFTTKVAGHHDSYLLVNSINALFSGKSANPFEWIYHRVVDFVYSQHQSKGEKTKKRIADMKDAISNARSSKAKLSVVTKLFSLADDPSRGEIHEVFMGFLILKLIIASNFTQLDQLASSGSFGFILHLLEICRGSPLVQSCGLQCLHAHFANCKPRELLSINGNMHGRKMRSHKKPSSVEPLITELSKFIEGPSLHVQSTSKGQSGEGYYSGSLKTGSGSLKTFLEAMSDVAESYNEELVSWQKNAFKSAVENSLSVLNALVHRSGKNVVDKLLSWGFPEVVKEIFKVFPAADARVAMEMGIISLCASNSPSTAKKRNKATSVIVLPKNCDEFTDFLYALANGAFEAKHIGDILKFLIVQLGVTGCAVSLTTVKPSVIKSASILFKDKGKMFVSNGGTLRLLEMICGGNVAPSDAKDVLKLVMALLNISDELSEEILNQGLLKALNILMESVCKTGHLVAFYTLCILHKLATNGNFLMVMKEEQLLTSLKEMKKSTPEYDSSIKELTTALEVAGYMVEDCNESVACVLLEINNTIVNTLASSRLSCAVPAIPHLSSYLTVLAEGNKALDTVSQSRCWQRMEVSNSDYSKQLLTDDNPSTFWESYRDHWIKLYMKHGCIVKRLTIDVSNSDRRHLPKTVTVRGGTDKVKKQLNSVSIPLEANGTFVLLEAQTEYFEIIEIRIQDVHLNRTEVRLRGLHCTCYKESLWPQFSARLSTELQLLNNICVTTWRSGGLRPMELYDRLLGALTHQQRLADLYFHTPVARRELGRACRLHLVRPVIEGILNAGSAGSIEQLLEEYINNMDLPVNSTSAFFKCSSSQNFPLSPFISSPGSQTSLIDQRLKMIGMSTIRQLCHVVYECICLLRGGDSGAEDTEGTSSALNPAKACYEKLEECWSNLASKHLKPLFFRISSNPVSRGESISEYVKIVDKLQIVVERLFDGDVRLLNKIFAVASGVFPLPVTSEDVIKFHVAINVHINSLVESSDVSGSDTTLKKLATLLQGSRNEATVMFEYSYRYYFCRRLLNGRSPSLSSEKTLLTLLANAFYWNLPQKVMGDVERSIELAGAFTASESYTHLDSVTGRRTSAQGPFPPSAFKEQWKLSCYQQGVLSVLVLTPVFWPIKFEKLSGPTALPQPLKSFCIDYQQFYASAWNGNISSHEKPRKLKWTLSGWGVVEYHGCLYKVSTAQLLVLLQFNSVDTISVTSLAVSTQINSEFLARVLKSLTFGENALLCERHHSGPGGSSYVLNPLSHKQCGLHSSIIDVHHEDDPEEPTIEEVLENDVLAKSFKAREATLDCAIIQVMKEEKSMSVDELLSKIINSCRKGTLSCHKEQFECSRFNALGRIEYLVSVGYLEYHEKGPHIVVYSESSTDKEQVFLPGSRFGSRKRQTAHGDSRQSKQKKTAPSTINQLMPLPYLPSPNNATTDTFKEHQMQAHIGTVVEEIANAFVLTTGEAEILLHHHKWNKDRLMHQGRSERTLEALLVEAGLSRPGDLMVTSGNKVECPVCLGPLNDPLSLDCNHGCCRDCWIGHLKSQIDFSQLLNAKCPIRQCTLSCTRSFIEEVFNGDGEVIAKFESSLVTSFVDHSDDFKWCSNPRGCASIIRKPRGLVSGVCRACGWVSCFRCSFIEGHEPATCDNMVRWVQDGGYYKYMDEEQKSKLLEIQISKKCPKCYVSIEKNDGCLHMVCRCGHDFCWRCLKPWKPLHKDYYSCTIEISREAVKYHKLSEYNSKCAELFKSAEQMLDLKSSIETSLTVSGLSLAQFNFMLDACCALASSYKMLAYAYVADYYKSDATGVDYLPALSQNMSKDARLLQGFIDLVRGDGSRPVQISDIHLNEGRRLVRNLQHTRYKILVGARQKYALLDVRFFETRPGASNDRGKSSQSGSFPVEVFFDTNLSGVPIYFGLLPSLLGPSCSEVHPSTKSTPDVLLPTLSEDEDLDTVYGDEDDDMDSDYGDLYGRDFECICGRCT